jgi:hypothetical protein
MSNAMLHGWPLPVGGWDGFTYDIKHLRPNLVGRLIKRCWPLVTLPVLGRLLHNVVSHEQIHNLIPTEGRNHIWDVTGHAGSQVTTWYVALFEGNYTPVSTDTAANFAANATECTAYSEATRQAWVEAAPSSGVITNAASMAVFTMNATKTLYGSALLSSSTKGSTSGVLLSIVRFSVSKPVVSGDVVQISHPLTLTST